MRCHAPERGAGWVSVWLERRSRRKGDERVLRGRGREGHKERDEYQGEQSCIRKPIDFVLTRLG
jgi:hypothetical protein